MPTLLLGLRTSRLSSRLPPPQVSARPPQTSLNPPPHVSASPSGNLPGLCFLTLYTSTFRGQYLQTAHAPAWPGTRPGRSHPHLHSFPHLAKVSAPSPARPGNLQDLLRLLSILTRGFGAPTLQPLPLPAPAEPDTLLGPPSLSLFRRRRSPQGSPLPRQISAAPLGTDTLRSTAQCPSPQQAQGPPPLSP